MSKVWERQPGETSKAYAAFCIYRNMGTQRSMDKTRETLGKKPGYRAMLETWSSKYDWVARASAYDDYLEEKQREKWEKERLEMAERHAKLAMAFQQKVYERLATLNPAELSSSDLARWLDIAVKIERISRGEPTEIGKQEVQGQVQTNESIASRIEHYAEIYRELSRRSILQSGNESDDTGKPLDNS